jgi:hypothetical protein
MAHKLLKIEIRPVENGGHIVTHHAEAKMSRDSKSHTGMNYMPPEEEYHVFGKHEGHHMLAHVANHLGIKENPEMPREQEESERSDYQDGDTENE